MIQNPSFELPGVSDPLIPQHWIESSEGLGEESADFRGNTNLQLSAYESFERGWARDASPQIFITNLDADPDYLAHLPTETMSFWSINQVEISFGALEAANFDEQTSTVESFEVWIEFFAFKTSFADEELESTSAETFEWAFIGVGMMGSVATATFNSSSDTRETFIVRPTQIVQVQSQKFRTAGSSVPYVGAQDDVVTFRTTGELPSEVAEDIAYYVFLVENNFITISRTPHNSNGTALVINDSGTGVHRIVGDPSRFWIDTIP